MANQNRPTTFYWWDEELYDKLDEARQLHAKKAFKGAREILDEVLKQRPDNEEANLLLSRLYLEGDEDTKDAEAALFHAEQALRLEGGKSPIFLKAMAEALGTNNRAEEGVTYLEKTYEIERREEGKKAAEELIASYRIRFNLGQLWQFADESGRIPYESAQVEEIKQNLVNGNLSSGALCRKNRVGYFHPIKDSLVKAEGPIEVLYQPLRYHIARGAGVSGILAVIICLVAGFYTFYSYFDMELWRLVAFIVIYLFMWGSGVTLWKSLTGLLVLLLGCGILVALAWGRVEVGFLLGLITGFTVSLILSGLIGMIPGGLVGLLIGLIRSPWLPKLPKE